MAAGAQPQATAHGTGAYAMGHGVRGWLSEALSHDAALPHTADSVCHIQPFRQRLLFCQRRYSGSARPAGRGGSWDRGPGGSKGVSGSSSNQLSCIGCVLTDPPSARPRYPCPNSGSRRRSSWTSILWRMRAAVARRSRWCWCLRSATGQRARSWHARRGRGHLGVRWRGGLGS